MATLYGNQYKQAYVDVPSSKVAPGDIGGGVRAMYFDYTITAAPTDADIIKVGMLPKGARVINAALSFPDLGSAGVLQFGWAASAELDSAGTTVEAADADGLLAAVDVNAAAASTGQIEQANMPGFLKNFAGEVELQITVTTAWTVTSGTLRGVVQYVIV